MNKEMTGYPSIDKPWDSFYSNIIKKDTFLNTTPYIGLIQNNRNYPDEIAVEYFGTKVRYGELLKSIDNVAKSLLEYGVKKGDFVTICSTTTPEVICTFYAISKIGAVANVMSPFFSPDELLSRINECDSRLIIIVDKFLPRFRDVLEKEKDKTIIVLPMMNSSLLKLFSKKVKVEKSNEVTWNQFIADGSNHWEPDVEPYCYHSPMAMVYSSGTTGASKGILLSVDSFQLLINAYGNSGFDTSRRQTVYQNIPPWHSTGLSLGINFPLSYGVKVCTDPRFDHDVFIKNVLKYKPDYILTNTSMYQGFTTARNLKRLQGKSLGFLKYPVEGGEPLTEKDIDSIEHVFHSHGSSARLLNGYGECECGATVTTDITSYKFSNLASGIPLPDITTIGIFDDQHKELKYGQRGNILVSTKIGMLEYYKNPDATKDFFYEDPNGVKWSRTGDIGYINSDGSLVVLGRKEDRSIIHGVQFYNFDIERACLQSEKIKLCEIQTHPADNNKLIAHIVWENSVATHLQLHPECVEGYLFEIQELIYQKLNMPEVVPNVFRIWDAFPSAPSGKRDISYIKSKTDNLIEVSKFEVLDNGEHNRI